MRHHRVLVGLIAAAALGGAAAHARAEVESVDDPVFFRLALERATPRPSHVVVFISGDGGWNEGARAMSAVMAATDALVIGVDVRYYMRYLRNADVECSDLAADLAALAGRVQRNLGYPAPVRAWLAGYSSGATMVYAALVQAAPGTFRGAMAFGFCPDLPVIKPLCRGNGLEGDPVERGRGWVYRPARTLRDPFVAFQGDLDQVCRPDATRAFVAATPHAEVVELANAGHGFAVLQSWSGQFTATFRRLEQAAGAAP